MHIITIYSSWSIEFMVYEIRHSVHIYNLKNQVNFIEKYKGNNGKTEVLG